MPTEEELQVLLLSLRVAGAGTALAFPVGLAASWVLARSAVKGRVLLDTLVSFPLVLPPVVTGYALLLLLGDGSPVGRLLQRAGVDLVFTWVAAALAAGLVSLPLMVRAMEAALAGVDTRLEMAARSLGAGPWRSFGTVTLPLAARGILAGVALAFARALGEFGATIVVAGNIPGRTQTLPLAVFTSLQTGSDWAAVRYILFSLALAVAALALYQRIARRVGG